MDREVETAQENQISILLLADNERSHANTVVDHIAAFVQHSQYKIHLYNPRWIPRSLFLKLDEFDVVVIHYSLAIIHPMYLPIDLREKMRRYDGLIVQYIQDDYRQVDQYTEMMRYLGVDVLFTPYPQEKIPQIYNEERLPSIQKFNVLTGYVPERYKMMEKKVPIEMRPIDVGYRGRELPYWLGKLGQEKKWIAQRFSEEVSEYGIICDIAWKEEDRIYGPGWDQFISSCKAMLGTESGASITDFDGSVEEKTKEYLRSHPEAGFWEVYENLLKPYEGNLIENTISPRIFECVAHRTALILFPGHYSGIIKPWEHYIPLEKDFSNIEEVIEKIHDINFLDQLTERVYRELIDSDAYSYKTMIREFDLIIDQFDIEPRNARKIFYRSACIGRKIVLSVNKVKGLLCYLLRVAQVPVWIYRKIKLRLFSPN